MRGWIYDVEYDLQKNTQSHKQKTEKLWFISYFIIVSITLVYIILYTNNKSDSIEKQHIVFFTVICVCLGALILLSIFVNIYYLKRLQVVSIEGAHSRSNVQRHSQVRGGLHAINHHPGAQQTAFQSKLNRQNTGKINAIGKFAPTRLDSNQSFEDLNKLGNIAQNQQNSSKIGSPKAKKEGENSNPSSQNSLKLQQQQQGQGTQAQVQQQPKKALLQRGRTLQFDYTGKQGKESNKLPTSSNTGGGIHMTEESNINSVAGGPSYSHRKPYSLKNFLVTSLLCSIGWIAVIGHLGCIYCFFARAPFWNTTQIWNGVILFALFPSHLLSILIYGNINVNLLIDRSFFMKLPIYKNTIEQIGYLSMILLLISLVWGSIVQIVKNNYDIPAIVLLSLISFAVLVVLILRKISYICYQFKKGYRKLVEKLNS